MFLDNSDSGLMFNKFACFNAGFSLYKNKYDRFIFHDFNIQINEQYMKNEKILFTMTIDKSNDPILLSHSSSKLVDENKHIFIINTCTFENSNGFPNFYWCFMNGYEEIENQLSGGLSLGRNWWEYSKQDYNDKIYKIIKPSEITYHYFIVTNFFEEIPIEADNKINEMRKFYEETYLDYRYLFNDVNNLNYDMANPELMNFFMITNTETHNEVVNHKILLTDQCGLYYYNLQDVFYNASTLQEYFENMFKISFPRKDIYVTIDSTSTSSSSDKIYKNDNVSKVIVEMEYHKLNNDLDMYEDETIQSDIEFLEDKIRKNKDNSMESKATIKKENDKLSQAIKKIKNKKAKLVKLPPEQI